MKRLDWKSGAAAITLCMIVFLGLFIALNKSFFNQTQTEGTGSHSIQSALMPALSDYPSSLSYWVIMNKEESAIIKNYNEMGMYKQLEKLTGTKVQFQHPPSGFDTGFNLAMIIASEHPPDVIETNWSSAQPDKAIKEGKIIRLNELIDQYAPNLSNLLKKKPDVKKLITSDEGNIYAFPTIADDPKLSIFNGLIVRKDWLDKLGLQPPKTIEDWENMLIAFRDKDPNGNGKQDEIPLIYNKESFFISYAFAGAYGITTDFYNDHGQIKYGPYEPRFKEYLALLHRWYQEGLIDQNYLTIDEKIIGTKVTQDRVGSFDGWLASDLGKYTRLMQAQNPRFQLKGVVFPSLQPGGEVIAKVQDKFIGLGAAITSTAKNPEQIAAWLDYGYSKEGHMLFNFGIEGESYTLVDGKPTFTDLVLNNPNRLPVSQALTMYTRMGSSAPFEYSVEGYDQYNALPEQMEAKTNWLKADHKKLLPILYLSADEQIRESAIMSDLLKYQDEMMNKFIMGIEPLDNFETYRSMLKKMGIEDELEIKQKAFERYLKK
ncbi:extracellular solute-binding protein [Paenibacillus eucommiae]|uniref:Aldouronate transport system substrate-binding protein n=1 Tax=Paenibacillus eucommiae TaxID=1355755 RepID=A0ABS4J7D6_9BACL|nr:extracellular solute-binding protein [Paenibacillus eucommiae]MBP1995766.1 putative aldouronate transport system substrate-binding protein [Paenibacillus eucommiae]